LFVVGLCWCYFLHGGVLRLKGPASPRCGSVFPSVLYAFGTTVAFNLLFIFIFKKEKKKEKKLPPNQ
jgi:hypothetical protein